MPDMYLDDRTVLRVSGADTRSFLQGLLTSDVDGLRTEAPLYAGLLSPQGKALFDMLLFDDGDGAVLIDVAASRAEALARRLTMYRMRKAVAIETTALAVRAATGAVAGRPLDPRLPDLGSRWIDDADGEPSSRAYDTHRLALGVPGSDDIGDDELLWLETGADLLNGVSFTKGCYVGQENTARMHHRDKVRRRLVPVSFDADPGDGVLRDAQGRSAGTLRSHRDGHGIAHLRIEAAAGPLTLGGGAAVIGRPDWLTAAFAVTAA